MSNLKYLENQLKKQIALREELANRLSVKECRINRLQDKILYAKDKLNNKQ